MGGVLGGEDLRKLRNEVCYSQEYMAKKLGLAQSTYQRLETGEIKISEERLLKIAEILEKSVDSIMNFYVNKIDILIIQEELALLRQLVLNQKSHIEELKLLLASKG